MKPLWMRGDSKPTMGVLLSQGKSEHGTHMHRRLEAETGVFYLQVKYANGGQR